MLTVLAAGLLLVGAEPGDGFASPPRLRGAMVGANASDDDLRTLGRDWGANLVRWQLIWGGFPKSPADTADLAAYRAWLAAALERLDAVLPVCAEVGMGVVVDLHTPPGGRDEHGDCRLFRDSAWQDAFVEVWREIAARYRGRAEIWGFDLLNEPSEGKLAEGVPPWNDLVLRAALAVREVDPARVLIVEPAPWGGPKALEGYQPLPLKGVVYSVHLYEPHKFTHQGVYEAEPPLVYPGTIQGTSWDIERLREVLAPVVAFQKANDARIYIGEFSAIRWAPEGSAFRYLNDAIRIFEEQGWDWSYHAYREWPGWSVEHGTDRADEARSREPTDREQLLRRAFGSNQRFRDDARPDGPEAANHAQRARP